jgi:hypothetical protein
MDLSASGQSLNRVRVATRWDIINIVSVFAQNGKRATARDPFAEQAVHSVESGGFHAEERHGGAARSDDAMVLEKGEIR